MRALDRKLWRDLWQLKGQAAAIAFVIAAGVATYVMFLATLQSLQSSRDSFYRDYRFGDVFAILKRAPETLEDRLRDIPGVSQVSTRVVAPVTIDIADFDEPVTGLITSLPDDHEPLLNDVLLRAGRRVMEGRDDEVVVSEAFADAHGFRPGDKIAVTIKGKRKQLTIVGTGISPEYIHQLSPGGIFPDYKRFGVLWMARTPLANAYEMEGAFNDVVLGLVKGADQDEVIDRLDSLLKRYGGNGAYGRADQPSHHFLHQEFRTLESLSGLFPAIFLGVAAFLLNVVVNRLVGMQREQIATLKAFGYSNVDVGLHYLKLVLVIVLIGSAIGLAAGAWLGYQLAEIYTIFFRLPYLSFRLQVSTAATGVVISAVAALIGTYFAVRRAAGLQPAQAMRPEAPAVYRKSLLERLGLRELLTQPSRMVLRHIGHRPVKSALSVLGIAFSVGILMTGRFQPDTVNFMMHLRYDLAHREDLTITFVEPTSRRAVYNLVGLPGVHYGEGFRRTPVVLHFGQYTHRTLIEGMERDGHLQRLIDADTRRPVTLPTEGMVLTGYLADQLGLSVGDLITVDLLDQQRTVRVPFAGRVTQTVGTFAYMDLRAMNRLLQEGDAISGAYLAIDPRDGADIYRELEAMPRVAGTVVREREVQNFRDTMEETMLFYTYVSTVLAGVIAFGVVYNSARITLTERSRDLASLRVLGFTRGEISYILLGELAIITLLAIPLGLYIGRGLCLFIAASLESDLYRVPLILEPSTYAFAATVVAIAAALSALVVRSRLDHLDLIGVLKTRE